MIRTILLVEDEADDVFFLKNAFQHVGILNLLQIVRDGKQAVDYLGSRGPYADRGNFPLPGLVLLDLKLPHLMGLDVLRWIRAQPALKDLIVIIFTSSSLASDIEDAYRLGANGYLVKTGDLVKLREICVGIKQFWLTLNQDPAPDFNFLRHALPDPAKLQVA